MFTVLVLVGCAGCTAGSNLRTGPAHIGTEVQAHEWRGWAHETTGDWREWESTTTAGFVTGSANGGVDGEKEVSVGAYLKWDNEQE